MSDSAHRSGLVFCDSGLVRSVPLLSRFSIHLDPFPIDLVFREVEGVDHPLSETLLALSGCFHSASPRVDEAAHLMYGVTKIMIKVSKKMVLYSLKINIYDI